MTTMLDGAFGLAERDMARWIFDVNAKDPASNIRRPLGIMCTNFNFHPTFPFIVSSKILSQENKIKRSVAKGKIRLQ